MHKNLFNCHMLFIQVSDHCAIIWIPISHFLYTRLSLYLARKLKSPFRNQSFQKCLNPLMPLGNFWKQRTRRDMRKEEGGKDVQNGKVHILRTQSITNRRASNIKKIMIKKWNGFLIIDLFISEALSKFNLSNPFDIRNSCLIWKPL